MRTDRLYIASLLSSAVFVLACLALLFAFVYLTGFWGLGIISAVVLTLFSFLYGWTLPFGLLRKRSGPLGRHQVKAENRLTKEDTAERIKV